MMPAPTGAVYQSADEVVNPVFATRAIRRHSAPKGSGKSKPQGHTERKKAATKQARQSRKANRK